MKLTQLNQEPACAPVCQSLPERVRSQSGTGRGRRGGGLATRWPRRQSKKER